MCGVYMGFIIGNRKEQYKKTEEICYKITCERLLILHTGKLGEKQCQKNVIFFGDLLSHLLLDLDIQ